MTDIDDAAPTIPIASPVVPSQAPVPSAATVATSLIEEPQGRSFAVVVTLLMGMSALSIDVLLPAFDEMREEYGLAADSSAVAWVVTSFFLGVGLGQLVYGPLSDRYGRKGPLRVGLVICAASAFACTLAPNLATLIVLRVLWGLGAAAPRSIAIAVVRDVYSGERMARVMSLIMATFILVPIFAPGLGALAMLVAPWQIVYWLPGLVAAGLLVWLGRFPETLAPEHRRPVGLRSFAQGFGIVVRTRQTVAFGLAMTCIFAVMSSYLASSEIIMDDVYDRGDQFPIYFGALACVMGLASLFNARVVATYGIVTMVRTSSLVFVSFASLFLTLALSTGGDPPLWAFCAVIAVMLPCVAMIGPNSNTLAMARVPHVAGTAAALVGAVSTVAGALFGAVIDAAFDGTVRPFAVGAFVFAVGAVTCVHVLGRGAVSSASVSATPAS